MQHQLRLPRSDQAPGEARRAVVEHLDGILDDASLADARLLTSELVTNAFLHGRGEIVVRIDVDGDRVLVDVIDEGVGFDLPGPQDERDDLRGHGLEVVDAVAARWGIHEGTTHVWFELER